MEIEKEKLIWILCISSLVTLSESSVNDKVKPLKYVLKLEPDLISNYWNFKGEITISIKVLEDITSLQLHASNLTIDQQETKLIQNENELTVKSHLLEKEKLILKLEKTLTKGNWDLYLKFTGVLNLNEQKGFFRASYTNNEQKISFYVAANFEANYARRVFPCWDEPDLKAEFKISIVHLNSYTAVSNMPGETNSNNNKFFQTDFEKTPLISTSSLGFVISEFKSTTESNGFISVWDKKDIEENKITSALSISTEAWDSVKSYFGDKIPKKIDIFILPCLKFDAIGSLGLILINEEYFILKNDFNLTLSLIMGNTISRELVRQTLGHLINPTKLENIWVMEGISAYLQNIAMNSNPEWKDRNLPKKRSILYEEEEDPESPIMDISTPEKFEIFRKSKIFHPKLLLLFSMIRCITLKDEFKDVLKTTISTSDLGTLGNKFFAEIDKLLNNELNIEIFLKQYLTHKGYPVVKIARDINDKKLTVSQECFICTKRSYGNVLWKILISVTSMSSSNQTFNLLTDKQTTVPISQITSDDWIFDDTGYYRFDYDESSWQLIFNYLNSENYEKVPVLNRIQLVSDALWFYLEKKQNEVELKKLFSYFQLEKNHACWFSLVDDAVRKSTYYNNNKLLYLVFETLDRAMKKLDASNDDGDKNLLEYLKKIKQTFPPPNSDKKKSSTSSCLQSSVFLTFATLMCLWHYWQN